MEQYIKKSALVAEIDRMLETIEQDIKDKNLTEQNVKDRDLCTIYSAQLLVLRNLAKYLDILEVKEVDLEKEYEEFVVDDPIFGHFITNDTMGMELAKHFFELGLKAQKG